MIIQKEGMILYKDRMNKIYEASISSFSEQIENELVKYELKKLTVDSTDCVKDFSFITKFDKLTELEIRLDYKKKIDISFVNQLNKLKVLGCPKFNGNLKNTSLVDLAYKWSDKSNISECHNLENIRVDNCSDLNELLKQIDNLSKVKQLEFWRLSEKVFNFIETNNNIENVKFTYCPKIEDLLNIGICFPNATKVTFDHCKNIKSYAPLKKLKKLQELVILESAPIDDMAFIGELPDLSSIKIGKTKIAAENKSLLEKIENVDLFMV